MRPVRLELEGFTAFRDRAEIVFDGVDLFALCGPTGAGKTSVIDAVTFALYGSVPRLDDKSVAPVVSQGRNEAKVQLDFTVDGEAYRVIRVVRNGSTKEARLVRESDEEVLADKARDLNAAVEDLLGLDYHQFTTCVSLPQGEFARFLHAEPRHRQDLLVRLLGWGLYDTVRAAAGQRAAAAGMRREIAEGQLADLAGADDAAEAAAAARVAVLTELRDRLDAAQPELDALARAADDASAAAAEATKALALLDGVAVPAGIDELGTELATATEARLVARTAEDAAGEALAQAEVGLSALEPRARLEAVLTDRAQLARLRARVDTGEAALAQAVAAETKALDAVEATKAALDDAEDAYQRARTATLAHALAAELVVGEPCPVCRSTVTEVGHEPPPDVEAADRVRRAALNERDASASEAAAATAERVRVEEKLAGLVEQVAALAERLRGAPDEPAVAAALDAVTAAETAVTAARGAAADAQRARKAADARVEAAADAEARARRAFDGTRDRIAALAPPAPARVDLVADWAELLAWVGERRPAVEADAARHRQTATASRAELDRRTAELVAAVADAGVPVTGTTPRAAVGDELAAAVAALDRVRSDRARAAELRATVEAAAGEQAVAKSVADHLAANKFERWLLDEALQLLVAGATERLRDLSGGAYSLCLDDKSRAFAVIDHVNADHVRSARTLSGGETFLASLALALALADQVAALAAGSAARLETVLLDEGFGTLDPESLDVVAAALEELGARGRMVGIVTHVQELAERLPVRFQIRKVGGAASVERVDA